MDDIKKKKLSLDDLKVDVKFYFTLIFP